MTSRSERLENADYPQLKPVYTGYLADPYALRAGGSYYMIGTGSPDDPVIDGRCFPALVSHDFVHWEYAGHLLVQPDTALGDSYWAPEIAMRDGKYYLYYSVGFDDKRHHLRVAIAGRPLGPYKDSGIALTDLRQCPFAIDPSPFCDVDGNWYLFYARDFLNDSDEARAGTALVMRRMTEMLQLSGEEIVVARARRDWQRFLKDREMYGRRWDWHTLEGPFTWLRNGRYYCFYSGGRWESDRYGVDYVASRRVTGPYEDDSNEEAARITHSVHGRIIGPGHNSIVLGPDNATYIVYHAWNEVRTVRSPYISRLDWSDNGPLPVKF